MRNDQRFFSNIYLAAYLITREFSIERIEKENGRLLLGFAPSEQLDSEVKKFINDEALVHPAQFQDALNRIKDLIFTYSGRKPGAL